MDRILLVTFFTLFSIGFLLLIIELAIYFKRTSPSKLNIDELQGSYGRFDFPYVAIIKEKGEYKPYKCLGAIIDVYRIMTLAQCVQDYSTIKYEIIVGKYWLGKFEEYDEHYDVNYVTIHPLYNASEPLAYNYAMLYVKYITFSNSICKSFIIKKGELSGEAFVHGWGMNLYNYTDDNPSEMKTTAFILSEDYCKIHNPDCSGRLNPSFDKYCIGNIGSPIIREVDERLELIGFALTEGFPCSVNGTYPVMLKMYNFD